ncbi:unnamed protein product, partial [Staurois parvus]
VYGGWWWWTALTGRGGAGVLLVNDKGGLTTHGAPGNRGSWGPLVLAQTQKSL